MARDGWITIRNVPLPRKAELQKATALHSALKLFFKEKKICKNCSGDGYTIKRELERSPGETIKYLGINSLIKLKRNSDLNFGDKIKEILLHIYAGKRPCKSCLGFGFVSRDQEE